MSDHTTAAYKRPTRKIYRVEHSERGHGAWYDHDGNFCPAPTPLRDVPMPYSQYLSANNLLSATKTLKELRLFFDKNNMKKLIELGFKIVELEVLESAISENYCNGNKRAYVNFTRDSVIAVWDISFADMFKEVL